jgi:hypothetical protein
MGSPLKEAVGPFGKPLAGLQRILAFRGDATAGAFIPTETAPERRTQKAVPYWVGTYVPTNHPDEVDEVRLIAGKYTYERAFGTNVFTVETPYLQTTLHRNRETKKTCICSGGPLRQVAELRSTCFGCEADQAEASRKRGKPGKRVYTTQELEVYNVLVYGKFYRVPRLNAQGVHQHSPGGEPYFDWIKPSNPEDPRIRQALEDSEGRLMHWEAGPDIRELLHMQAYLAMADCAACGNRSSIKIQRFVCPNCAHAMDPTRLTLPQKLSLVNTPIPCPTCQQVQWFVPTSTCKHCETPKPATLYDKDLSLHREGYKVYLDHVSAPKEIPAQYARQVYAKELSSIYVPTPLEWQGAFKLLEDKPAEEGNDEAPKRYPSRHA